MLLLGYRTLQIMNGSDVFVDIESKEPLDIAKEELKQKKIPFKIKRKLPNGNVEIWNISDFENI